VRQETVIAVSGTFGELIVRGRADGFNDILEAFDLLDVDTQQLAGCFALVALNHFRRPQVIAGTTAFWRRIRAEEGPEWVES
jgi:hypothetical protein